MVECLDYTEAVDECGFTGTNFQICIVKLFKVMKAKLS